MKKWLLSILMALALCLSLLPVTALAANPAEQFPGLTPGETYWFDLSGENIPGDKNGSLPDDSLHWVPFTYAGTVNAYVLKSRSANDNDAKDDAANAAGSTDPMNPIGYTYDHSLFIADYNVTLKANWANLNGKNLIFGTAYTSRGVDYTLRVPSAGSGSTGSQDSERGTPLNNEWDAILDKANQSYQDNTVGYIKNWNAMDSWGQDTQDGPDPDWNRATRGSSTARSWQFDLETSPSVGFRPVLELPSSDSLGSDGLATVTLDLNGGSISSITGTVNLAVKSDFNLTLPGGTDVTRPDGNDGIYFMWQDSSGNLYEPGTQVPANVGRLTALWEGWTELTKDVLESTYKGYSVGAYFYRLPSGNYYLGEDISVDIGIDIGTYATPANVVLDLNGHELKDVSNNTTGSLIFFPSTSSTNTLTLMDSSSGKTGKVIKSSGETAKLSANAKLNANGGTIEGLVELVGDAAVIDNTDPSNVTVFTGWVSLYGGTIKGGIFTGTIGMGGGTISDSAKVTVAFNSDGGSTVTEQKVLRGQKASAPTEPTKTGYSFNGWYKGNTAFDFTNTTVTENITLTAKWTKIVTATISAIPDETYTGRDIEPAITVYDGETVIPASEYTVSYSDNRNAGTATVTLTDKTGGNYVVSGSTTFEIKPKSIENAVITSNGALTYNGEEQTQNVAVSLAGFDTVTFDVLGNKQTDVNTSGNYTLTVTGNGNFTGSKELEWNIEKADLTENTSKLTTARVRRNRTLAEALVTEGEMLGVGNVVINGSFAWEDPSTVITEDSTAKMKFTPADGNYNEKIIDVSVSTYSSSVGRNYVARYTVNFDTNGGNEIASQTVTSNSKAAEPTKPTKNGYIFDGWYTDGEFTSEYDFDTKVTKNITLYAKWTEIEKEPDKPTQPVEPTAPEWKNLFTDVKENDWFFESVKYVNQNGLMSGTTNTTFAPNEPLTRGMLVCVLYRAAGEPAVNKSIPFSDVKPDMYYANAVIWAQQNGIVNGVTETEFAPDENITREQIAAIMFRYAKYKGYDVSVGENTNILSYTDFEKISEYAIEAIQFAVGSGLMKGKTESTINPKDLATRAEIAAILQRFIEGNK